MALKEPIEGLLKEIRADLMSLANDPSYPGDSKEEGSLVAKVGASSSGSSFNKFREEELFLKIK